MEKITIKNANLHNLKNVSVEVPLHQLVVVVGPSGSGKTSLIYDILYKHSQKEKVDCEISDLPKTYALNQKVIVPKSLKLSLGEYNLKRLDKLIKKIKKDELLIVDEPCAGLSAEQSIEVLSKLKKLVKNHTTVIAIEHSKEIIKGADYVIEFGPKAGKYGGEITFQGNLEQFKNSNSITAKYVFSNLAEQVIYDRNPSKKAKAMKKNSVTIKDITKNNLANFQLTFPLGSLDCLYGNTGTGKSTLLNVVYSVLYKGLNAWKIRKQGGVNKGIIGKQNVRRTYLVDQTPIGKHPSSRPATYLKFWDSIRDIYINLPDAQKLNLRKSNFIVTKGILENTEFFSPEVLSVKYKNINISDLLKLTVDEAIAIFSDSKLIKDKLGFLQEVGLGYLTLGQKSDSLSSGEAQRIKLAKVLSKKLGDRCVYILDTPTKGLHLSDLPILVKVLQKIIDKNNTVLIADNRIEMINNSDYSLCINK